MSAVQLYADSIRVGSLIMRWHGGRTIRGRLAGISLCLDQTNMLRFMVGLWWFAFGLQFFLAPRAARPSRKEGER